MDHLQLRHGQFKDSFRLTAKLLRLAQCIATKIGNFIFLSGAQSTAIEQQPVTSLNEA